MKACKKLLTLLMALLMLTVLALPVAADVIYEPQDSFYAEHHNECTYNGYRRYLTNSEAGYVYLYQNPKSKVTVASYPNGETVSISWLYTAENGEVWGIIHDDSGWVKMSELSVIYDSESFLEDHKDECRPYTEGTFTIDASEENPVIIWAYPGGEKEDFTFTWPEFIQSVQMTYSDDAENVWGYIGYARGIRDVWVCLNAPHSETVGGYALEHNEVELKAEPTPPEEIPVSEGNTTVFVIVGVLIAAVVIGTVVIIAVTFRKKKARP